MKILIALLFIVCIATADEAVIYPTGIATLTGPFCGGGNCAGYATYAKQRTNGWGYVPTTNDNTSFGVTYTNNVKVRMQSLGKNGDTICGITNSLLIANPPYSPAYRFTVYFLTTNDIPTNINQCGLVVTNFNP